MKLPYTFRSLFTGLILCSSLAAPAIAADQYTSLEKRHFLSDLDCIQHIFEVKYAPAAWKATFSDWSLETSIKEAKEKIQNHPSFNQKEGQIILRDFFNSTKDYHVGVRFYSTECATLPFLIASAQGRYFFTFVDAEIAFKSSFPFEAGDEILTFDGQPIDEVIDDLREREFGYNTLETDQTLAEITLTTRRGDMGQCVPSGTVRITGCKKGSQRELATELSWYYTPEKIDRINKLNATVGIQSSLLGEKQSIQSLLKTSDFFNKMMVSHLWDRSFVGARTKLNPHDLGSKTSFIPQLGRTFWKAPSDMLFDAYIFESPSGKRIGYIRIPHYNADEEEVEEFGSIMNFFQQHTDALVIDQVNNPGGDLFYLYGLVSTLTDTPLYTPKHYLSLTQEEVYVAQTLLPFLEEVESDRDAHEILGDNIAGYPVDYQFVSVMKTFCHFLIDQWAEYKLVTDPTFLFGFDEIHPHPDFQYNKPILVLINSLDFSCADFFPAMMQDNKKATIFGTRTAGAGGYVAAATYPNLSGMKGFQVTGSLAERINHEPIENLGVIPDVEYSLTVTDLQNNYKEYVSAVLETVESLIEN